MRLLQGANVVILAAIAGMLTATWLGLVHMHARMDEIVMLRTHAVEMAHDALR